MMWLVIAKTCFLVTLSTIFLFLFGIPAFKTYNKRATITTGTMRPFEQTDHPAITIMPYQHLIMEGWKDVPEGSKSWSQVCNISQSFHNVSTCINEKNFKVSEVIEKTASNAEKIIGPESWKEELTRFMTGKVFSLNSSFSLGATNDLSLKINFKSAARYAVFIHDPHFYLNSFNPKAFPHILIDMFDTFIYQVYLEPVKHQMLTRCEQDESYSFTACVRTSISRSVGCRLEWDTWSPGDIPVCSTVDQLLQSDKEYAALSGLDRPGVVDYTGCLAPCSYTEYTLASVPLKRHSSQPMMLLTLASSWIKSNKEELAYNFVSFVAEFGGSLGLFLGFSFNMFWDVIEYVLVGISKVMKKNS